LKPTEPTPSRWDAVLELDARWSERLRLPPTAKVRRYLWSFLAHSGDSWFWLAAMLIIWLAAKGEWHARAPMYAGGMLVLAIFVLVIKFRVRRERPSGNWGMLYRSTDPHSFPSGHAARVALLAVMAWGLGPLWLAGLLTLWAPLVILSRVRMGVHYLLDVAVGALVGVAAGQISLLLEPLFRAWVPFMF